MASETVFILIGSNIGERESLLERACALVGEFCGRIIGKSAVYESEPWGFEAEQWFLNQVIEIETELPPDDLMLKLMDIEKDLGRDRTTPHKGYVSRPMDLDILYYGNKIVDTEYVTAPHPRLHLRRFTLMPLCDVAPDFINSKMKMSNARLLELCNDEGLVKKYEK
ncbi:MAG: 2-amino-4-hydroxy-6-hydroxymethyldihydropteridine diphosphokinase [Bacteroidales bacterium]|nr:2-amino-4-hydroxy-6-hydroxymethyldihydropteridine diphosphokinase [Bacteroidales bacterium]